MPKELKNLEDQEQTKVLGLISDRFNISKDFQTIIFQDFAEYYEMYRGSQQLEDTWKSQVHVPYVQQVVDTILPRLVSSKPKINVLPREEEDVDSAQQMEKLVDYQWEKMRMHKKLKMWAKLALIYGVGIVKVGWDFDKKADKDSPWVEPISPYDFFIDPHSSNISSAKYVIFKQNRDFADVKANKNYINLDKLEGALSDDEDKYKIQERSSLSRPTPGKDTRKTVVVYEYYGRLALDDDEEEEDYMVVTANNGVLLRIEKLDDIYPCGKPFVELKDNDIPLDFWAMGEVEPLVPMQEELNTLRNQRLDNRKLIINNMWSVNKNAGVDWEDFVSRPGGIITHDGSPNAVVPLIIPDTTQGSVQEEAIIKQDMDRTSGVFAGMMGQLQSPEGSTGSNINTTARGFLASVEAAGTRMQYKLDNLDDSIRELGQKILKLNQKYINKDQVVRIVGKSGAKFEEVKVEDIGKEYDLRVEGGATQPQNQEARKQDFFNLLQLLVPLSQVPMVDFEPGSQPVPAQMNVKYFIDSLLDTFNLPNQEEAFISQEDVGLPQVSPQVAGAQVQPNETITEGTPPAGLGGGIAG